MKTFVRINAVYVKMATINYCQCPEMMIINAYLCHAQSRTVNTVPKKIDVLYVLMVIS